MLTLLMQWTWCFALAVLLELRFAVQMAKFALLSLDLLLGHFVTEMSVGELVLLPLSMAESGLASSMTWMAQTSPSYRAEASRMEWNMTNMTLKLRLNEGTVTQLTTEESWNEVLSGWL
jgi:hypothetical protein